MKFTFFRNILILSCVAVAILPVFATFFVHPSFTDLLTDFSEDEAVRLAAYLASALDWKTSLTKDTFSLKNALKIYTYMQNADLKKIKVFSPDGEVVYSTEPGDIGEINRKEYFTEVVAKGNPYTKIVRKKSKSLEDKIMVSDVVETYVPVMIQGQFIGAFEIYYDITKRKQKLDSLISRLTYLIYVISAGLLISVLVVSARGRRMVAERNHFEKALQESEEKYRNLYDNAPDMYHTIDSHGIIIDCNETGASILGYSKEEVIGRPLTDFLTQETKATFEEDYPMFIQNKLNMTIDLVFVRREGAVFPASLNIFSEFDSNGIFIRTKAIARDVTKLKELAETDPLTKVYNRRAFFCHLKAKINHAKRYKRPLSLIMFDIDHFKKVNDTYGHDCGDSVLQTIAETIMPQIRKADIFARYGGEEFLILCPETSLEGATTLAEKIRSLIAETRFDQVGTVAISLGVGIFHENDSNDTFLKRTDAALYLAKEKGRNRIEVSA